MGAVGSGNRQGPLTEKAVSNGRPLNLNKRKTLNFPQHLEKLISSASFVVELYGMFGAVASQQEGALPPVMYVPKLLIRINLFM